MTRSRQGQGRRRRSLATRPGRTLAGHAPASAGPYCCAPDPVGPQVRFTRWMTGESDVAARRLTFCADIDAVDCVSRRGTNHGSRGRRVQERGRHGPRLAVPPRRTSPPGHHRRSCWPVGGATSASSSCPTTPRPSPTPGSRRSCSTTRTSGCPTATSVSTSTRGCRSATTRTPSATSSHATTSTPTASVRGASRTPAATSSSSLRSTRGSGRSSARSRSSTATATCAGCTARWATASSGS